MIKIYDQLWFTVSMNASGNEALSYMTYYEENTACANRMATGTGWAGGSKNHPMAMITQNIPLSNFYIGSVSSRWSTSNKLFRVQDPRGFVVEVPSANISALLKTSTVVNGYIQNECVWGRDGNDHLLLPTNSEPYAQAMEQMYILKHGLKSIKDLSPGDFVTMFNDKNEYYYLGRVALEYNITPVQHKRTSYWSPMETITGHKETIVGQKAHVFLRKYGNKWYVETPSKPKIVKILQNVNLGIQPSDLKMSYVPQKVFDQLTQKGFSVYSSKFQITKII